MMGALGPVYKAMGIPNPTKVAADKSAELERKAAEEKAAADERIRQSGALGRRSLFTSSESGYNSMLGG